MKIPARRAAARRWAVAAMLFAISMGGVCRAQSAVALPKGVKAVWDLDKAYRETTPTRERICINGLWRWQPAGGDRRRRPPATGATSRCPGAGRASGLTCRRTARRLRPSGLEGREAGGVTAAWYQREITIPRRVGRPPHALSAEYLNSFAAVYVDGKKAGEMRFPGGEVDLTARAARAASTLSACSSSPCR